MCDAQNRKLVAEMEYSGRSGFYSVYEYANKFRVEFDDMPEEVFDDYPKDEFTSVDTAINKFLTHYGYEVSEMVVTKIHPRRRRNSK